MPRKYRKKQNWDKSRKYRNWVYTNFTLEEFTNKHIKYHVFQLEECPKSGKHHHQGYIEFDRGMDLKWIKKNLSDKEHFEPREGSQAEAIVYCTKEESRKEGPWHRGKPKRQGERSDLKHCVEMLKDGCSMYDILMEHPGDVVRYGGGLQKIHGIIQQEKTKERGYCKPKVTVIYGVAGSGKTRSVYEEHGFRNVFKLDQALEQTVWFDGYMGEKVVLLDDFYGNIEYGALLNLLDGYPIRLPIKGGHSWATWNKVYITSNTHPKKWYAKGYTEALKRRITKIVQK